jgi:hypothetical protein
VYAVAAFLSIAVGVLVTASFFIARYALGSDRVLAISLVVSLVFVGAGLLLFGIQKQVAAIVAVYRGHEGESLRSLTMHVNRLVLHLLVGGAFACALLGSLTYAILERIGQGVAVFG